MAEKKGNNNGYPELNNDTYKDTLLKEHIYLIDKIVLNFKDVAETQGTLKEVGYIALLNAVNLYSEHASKLDFKSYAQIMITGEIHQYLLNHSYEVEQPPCLIKINERINEYVITYSRKFNKYPTLSEIADNLSLTEVALQEVLKSRASLKETQLYHQLECEFDKLKPDLAKIKNNAYQNFKLPIQDVITIQNALFKIKKLQKNIIYYLFLMDLRKTKAANMLGLGISNNNINDLRNDLFSNSK